MKCDLMYESDENEPANKIPLENKFSFLKSKKQGWHFKSFGQIRL